MEMQVAVIGPELLVNRVLKYVTQSEKEQFLSFTGHPYKDESEVPAIIERCDKQQLFLFTGPVPYYLAINKMGCDLNADYISVSATALLRVIMEKGAAENKRKLRFSVDFISKDVLDDLFEDIGILNYEVYVKEYRAGVTSSEIVQFHSQLQEQGKVDFSITYLFSAYSSLLKKGLSVYQSEITNVAIREALDRLRTKVGNIIVRERQFCSGVVEIQDFSFSTRSVYEEQRLYLVVIDVFVSFCESINATFRIENNKRLFFVTTRGTMENISHGHQYMPLISQIEQFSPFTSIVGIGYGSVMNEAERKAQNALERIRGMGKRNCCCVMLEDDSIIDISNDGEVFGFAESITDCSWVALSKKCGISVMTFSKIMSFVAQKDTAVFTANDLARCLNITSRSARGILNSLLKGDVIEVVGEQGVDRGRPRRLFKLKMEKEGKSPSGGEKSDA